MVPISLLLARYYPPDQFAVVFGLIWLSYITTDAFAEIFGSLFGKQTIKVGASRAIHILTIEVHRVPAQSRRRPFTSASCTATRRRSRWRCARRCGRRQK